MPNEYSTLGQSAPSATSETTLYTVPSGNQVVVSSLSVCNRGATPTTFRISVSVAGAATTNKDYLYYNVPIDGNDTFVATVGIALSSKDVVRVYAGNANLSFGIWGARIL